MNSATWRRVWLEPRSNEDGSVTYRARWYDEEGRQRSRSFGKNKQIAEGRRREFEQALNAGMLDGSARIELGEFVREHLRVMRGQVRPASLKDQRIALEQFEGFVGSERRLDRVRVRDVEGFMARRLESVRPATANKALRTLRAVFHRAVSRGYLRVNPFDGVRPVREPERVIRVLTPGEIGRLLGACPDARWRALIGLALATGMRLGELLHLRWEDVSMEWVPDPQDLERMVFVGSVVVRNRGEYRTKSGKERRQPLLEAAGFLLQCLEASRSGFVFETGSGERMRNNVQRDFGMIVERAGIERCCFHDLRRTFVSDLAMSGENEVVIQGLAGHASINTTLKYTRIRQGIGEQAVRRLSYADFPSVPPVSPPQDEDDGERKTA